MINTKPTDEVVNARMLIIVRNAGGAISAKEFCTEHIKRGWAYDSLCPEVMGLEDNDIIRLIDSLQNLH